MVSSEFITKIEPVLDIDLARDPQKLNAVFQDCFQSLNANDDVEGMYEEMHPDMLVDGSEYSLVPNNAPMMDFDNHENYIPVSVTGEPISITKNDNSRDGLLNADITIFNHETALPKILQRELEIVNCKIYLNKIELLQKISSFSLNEQHLISWLIKQNSNKNIIAGSIDVDYRVYSEEVGFTGVYSYSDLIQTCDRLMQRFIDYHNETANLAKAVWFSSYETDLSKGIISLSITDIGCFVLTALNPEDIHIPTDTINKAKLTHHGRCLYDYLLTAIGYQKEVVLTVQQARELFNCVDSYPLIGEFHRTVIETAIASINRYTPYQVRYFTQKQGGGRRTTHYVFMISDKPDMPLSVIPQLDVIVDSKNEILVNSELNEVSQIDPKDSINISALSIENNNFNDIATPAPVIQDSAMLISNSIKSDPYVEKSVEKIDYNDQVNRIVATPHELVSVDLTESQIDVLVNNAEFCKAFALPAYETGSDRHIDYLRFRLKTSPTEFISQKKFKNFLHLIK